MWIVVLRDGQKRFDHLLILGFRRKQGVASERSTPVASAPSSGVYFDVRWHSVGRHLAAICSCGEVHILSLDDAPSITLDFPSEMPVVQVAWMDDSTLATATQDGLLQFWDVTTGTPLINEVRAFVDNVRMLARLDDEHLLIFAGDSFRIIGIDGRQHIAYYGHVMNPHVAWSADGQSIVSWPQATASDDAVIITWDTQTGAVVSVHQDWFDITQPFAYRPQSHIVAWSADARTSALTLHALGEDVVQIWDASQPEEPIVTLPIRADHLAWSPDGQILATIDRQLSLWSADGELLNETERNATRRLTWSPDGQYIAVDQEDVGVIIYTVPGLERILQIDLFDFNMTERIDWTDDRLIVSSSRGAFAYSLVDGSRMDDFDYAFVAVGNRFSAGYNRHTEEIVLLQQGAIMARYPFVGFADVSITDLLWNPAGDSLIVIVGRNIYQLEPDMSP